MFLPCGSESEKPGHAACPSYTDVYDPQQMDEAGEVTQRVLIKENVPC